MFPNGNYLLGDSVYPLSFWLMIPYRDNGHLTVKQKNYNFLHSSTRMAIERAFALLKGRFRRLKYVDIDRLEDLPYIILAACTLHNICTMSDNDVDDFLDTNDDVGADNDDSGLAESDATVDIGDLSGNVGKRKRDLISEQL